MNLTVRCHFSKIFKFGNRFFNGMTFYLPTGSSAQNSHIPVWKIILRFTTSTFVNFARSIFLASDHVESSLMKIVVDFISCSFSEGPGMN